MAIQSMTGFSRADGTSGTDQWAWEIRSVNGKGLDVRSRLPGGMERLEPEIRRILSEHFSRGNVQVNLSVTKSNERLEAIVNQQILDAILALKSSLGTLVDPAPMSMDTLLSVRGLVDFRESVEDAGSIERRDADMLAGLGAAAVSLKQMREGEGAAIGQLLLDQIAIVEQLAARIEADPARSPAEIARRIDAQVASLISGSVTLDRDRLHAEAALIATKADIREELDRLTAHIAATRELLALGGPVGRKLDFLAQEFNRESNTICSKSNATTVTAAGIELKVVIDQFREQIQNLE